MTNLIAQRHAELPSMLDLHINNALSMLGLHESGLRHIHGFNQNRSRTFIFTCMKVSWTGTWNI